MNHTQRTWMPRWTPLALALTAALGANLAACHQSPLHRSHGLRYKEMMAAQQNAHPSHEGQSRGEEGARAIRNYYDRYDQAKGGGAPPSGGQPTAGVMPLH